jgi:hypothetical protein
VFVCCHNFGKFALKLSFPPQPHDSEVLVLNLACKTLKCSRWGSAEVPVSRDTHQSHKPSHSNATIHIQCTASINPWGGHILRFFYFMFKTSIYSHAVTTCYRSERAAIADKKQEQMGAFPSNSLVVTFLAEAPVTRSETQRVATAKKMMSCLLVAMSACKPVTAKCQNSVTNNLQIHKAVVSVKPVVMGLEVCSCAKYGHVQKIHRRVQRYGPSTSCTQGPKK